MKLIVAGGRNYRLNEDDINKLNALEGVTELVSGNASGVDRDAEKWAEDQGVPIRIFKPDWKKYGRAAGPIRNKEMAIYADAVSLFPGGKGTDSMFSEAVKVNLIIHDNRKTAYINNNQ